MSEVDGQMAGTSGGDSESRLREEIAELRTRLAVLEEAVGGWAPVPAAPAAEPAGTERARSRRSVLASATAGSVAAAVGFVVANPTPAAAHLADGTGEVLKQFMDLSSPHVSPPALDTMVRWARRDPAGVGPFYTNEILSLVSDNTQTNSFAWPLYIELRGTDSPAANQNTSQSVGATVRTFNRSTGSPWIAGFHSETIHGSATVDGSAIAANGTTILFNGEVVRRTTAGLVIGLNLQNTGGSMSNADVAIQIQSAGGSGGTRGWQNGLLFQSAGGIAGNIGINFGNAGYLMGIDLADNSLRMNADQKLVLERFGSAWIQFNSSTGNIEIYKNYTRVASF